MSDALAERIASFWYDADGADGVSSAEISEAEARLGLALPPELRSLLALRNGGIARYDLFEDVLLAPFRGIGEKSRTGDLVSLYLRGGEPSLPDRAVIFAADSNAWFALDYGEAGGGPSVLYWSEYESAPVRLATSFGEFLMRLNRPEDHH